jgi:hypothetical protein
MRRFIFVSLVSLTASLACVVPVACGDDPGGSSLPYAYSIDATPDGVLESANDASVNRH